VLPVQDVDALLGAGGGMTTCVHCERTIVPEGVGRWVDPEATGDDEVWRQMCDANDTFVAEHEPAEEVAP
jgi:hypothetical protein